MCEELGNSGKDHQGHICSRTIWTCYLAGRKSADHEKPWKTQQHGVVKGFVAFVCGIHDLGESASKALQFYIVPARQRVQMPNHSSFVTDTLRKETVSFKKQWCLCV